MCCSCMPYLPYLHIQFWKGVSFQESKKILNILTTSSFCAKVCKSKSHFEMQKLPPTSAAARYHIPSCLLPDYGMEGESNHHAASTVGTANGSWKVSSNPDRATPSTTHTAGNYSFLLQNILNHQERHLFAVHNCLQCSLWGISGQCLYQHYQFSVMSVTQAWDLKILKNPINWRASESHIYTKCACIPYIVHAKRAPTRGVWGHVTNIFLPKILLLLHFKYIPSIKQLRQKTEKKIYSICQSIILFSD